MKTVRQPKGPLEACQIIDFDQAFFEACDAETRLDLLIEAELLATAFAPHANAGNLLAMAQQLSAGSRDGDIARAHARRLAAALKHLAAAA